MICTINRILQSPITVPKCSYFKTIHTSTVFNCTVHKNESYKTIYKFPYIRPFSVINRLKFYQSVLTGITVPTSFVLNQLNFTSFESFLIVSALGGSGCLTLYSLGYITMKFIGFIYYNEEKDMVKVSFVNFWGRREDIEIPAKDVMPVNELPKSATDGLFLKFRRYSTEDILKLNLQFGVIVDSELIKKVL